MKLAHLARAAVVCSLLLFALGASAEAGTLAKIKKSGTISLGYREASIPFSYIGDNGRPAGYSVDLCQHVAKSVQQQLGLADLKIRWVRVTPADRIEKLKKGVIDLECGSTTNALSRQEQVSFSLLTFADGASLLFKADANLHGLADMNGRKIGVVPGTTTEPYLQQAIGRAGVKAEVVALKEHAEGLRAVMEGRIDAYASDRVILIGLVLGSGNQKTLRISDQLFSYEPYALMLRRNDAAFRLAVDRELARLYRSEEIYPIYERWLGVLGPAGPLLKSMYFINGLPQ